MYITDERLFFPALASRLVLLTWCDVTYSWSCLLSFLCHLLLTYERALRHALRVRQRAKGIWCLPSGCRKGSSLKCSQLNRWFSCDTDVRWHTQITKYPSSPCRGLVLAVGSKPQKSNRYISVFLICRNSDVLPTRWPIFLNIDQKRGPLCCILCCEPLQQPVRDACKLFSSGKAK